jgi:hypothetical protein
MDSNRALLAKVVVRILRPLIRILLRFEVSHSEFAELAKRAYVDVAYRYFAIPRRKQTYSRAAVITGLSRKDVVRLRAIEEHAPPETKRPLNRAARVIGGWLRDSEFLGPGNQPKDLPLRGDSGSFETLVARYSGDITARAILDELVRVGAVTKPDSNTVHLSSSGYIPQQSETELLEVISRCAADLLQTSAHNLIDPANAHFQRQVAYRDIPESVAEEFRKYSHDRCQELMIEFNGWLAVKKTTTTAQPGEAMKRVGVGLYYFENNTGEG